MKPLALTQTESVHTCISLGNLRDGELFAYLNNSKNIYIKSTGNSYVGLATGRGFLTSQEADMVYPIVGTLKWKFVEKDDIRCSEGPGRLSTQLSILHCGRQPVSVRFLKVNATELFLEHIDSDNVFMKTSDGNILGLRSGLVYSSDTRAKEVWAIEGEITWRWATEEEVNNRA